ncbi:tripartite tricarboxylate transporter TctB family protein [Notoacmeibacter sp. MSK16QG-6]|uniref:tripartite tricarboxylate transporter TctB family protein n=1 Tax=Notoacmeibacter sp. MSK16QG-6 TaxID=2957982 RepID=UPI00209F4300|nr:tripartite tricarboxylate transporter TctB family protein [Notoacmeibacter sp. MSK16QG-6]MCP1200559.1 tripartite tricarboxylate transporter TctB family protein [Notoacmeibacter sp. MSK16QG-6]
MRTIDLIFSGVYLTVLLIAFTQIGDLREISAASFTSAKLFPQLVLGLGLVMGVIETLRTLFLPSPADEGIGFRQTLAMTFRPRRMLLLALFVIYLAAIKPLGFLIATGIFCFATIALLTPRVTPVSLVIAALVSVCTLALIYQLLVVYLQAFLP